MERFRKRPLEGSYPYVWLDATYLKPRQDGWVGSTAVVIAVGVKAQTGEREVLGLDVGPSEDGAFWLTFLRSLSVVCCFKKKGSSTPQEDPIYGRISAIEQACSERS